jgi:hypothetical protein
MKTGNPEHERTHDTNKTPGRVVNSWGGDSQDLARINIDYRGYRAMRDMELWSYGAQSYRAIELWGWSYRAVRASVGYGAMRTELWGCKSYGDYGAIELGGCELWGL